MRKLTIEYPLSTKSPKIVWDMISNAAGLQKWLADKVTEENDTMTESPLPESSETAPKKTEDVADVPHVRDETSTQENE